MSKVDLLEWLNHYLKELNLVKTMNQPNGFNRLGYSAEEWESMDVFRQIAEQLGLNVRRDEAGNCIARWEASGNTGGCLPAIAVGSHLDTVKDGGGYDGVAGVLCGLAAVKKLKEKGFLPAHPIEIICFASEESSRFGFSTIGSKAMSGTLPIGELTHIQDEEGITIEEAVNQRGLDWSKIINAERDQNELKSFIELHIEQGVRIEEAGAQFGVVTAIACPIRLKINVQGKTGHTGTTPMDKRRDTLVSIAPLISFISEQAKKISKENALPIVATVSTLSLQPNSMTAIPGQIELGVDIRSVDDELKIKILQQIESKCIELMEIYQVTIEINTLVNNPSVRLSEEVMFKLKHEGEAQGYKSYVMESGAGHDVMNMSKKWPSGLFFIPCQDGLSHHPDEYASLEDLYIGVDIIAAYLYREAKYL